MPFLTSALLGVEGKSLEEPLEERPALHIIGHHRSSLVCAHTHARGQSSIGTDHDYHRHHRKQVWSSTPALAAAPSGSTITTVTISSNTIPARTGNAEYSLFVHDSQRVAHRPEVRRGYMHVFRVTVHHGRKYNNSIRSHCLDTNTLY